jgi:predicted O-methyltransferase YrrM
MRTIFFRHNGLQMKQWIASPKVIRVLDSLYADAAKNDPRIRKAAQRDRTNGESETDYYSRALRDAYIPVGPDFGALLYTITRSSKAKTIVEFGTSFGISAIFLASAVRDNGFGKVITAEFVPEKAERARKNLKAAGLEKWVEIRVGDALETLKSGYHGPIDMVFLDGAKGLYVDVLRLLEPRLRKGALVASDNTDQDNLKDFLKYIRSPRNGYTSSSVLTDYKNKRTGHEISIRH